MVGETHSKEHDREGVLEFLEKRLSLSEIRHFAEKKKVPLHEQSVWYYMGGIAAIFLAVLVFSGILLMVYYVPEIGSAHASILKINSQIDFGWFVRSLHSWAGNLMILVVMVHLFSTYFMKAYRKPREITWWSGLVLMFLCLAFGFTGYLLPWDDVAFFATKIGLDVASKAPIVGESLARLLQGGDAVSQATISRFFVIHVAVLPLLLIAFLGIHVLLVQLSGMSEPEKFSNLSKSRRTYEKFFPNFFFKDILVWILALNGLFVLVMLCPWGIGTEADPFGPAPIGIKPEWYFLAPFQLLKLIPPMIGPIEGELFGIMLLALIGLFLLLVPLFDDGMSKRRAQLATLFGVALLLGLITFTIWGAIS